MKKLFFIILGFGLISCDSLFKDEELTLPRKDYAGNEVRTDGYYYWYTKNNSTPPKESTVVFFLYKNGIILSTGSYGGTNLDLVEQRMLERYESLENRKIGWGVFIVQDNKIEYEQWSTSVGGGLPVFRNSYSIINDTTLINYANEVCHFRQFSPKPDSSVANKWIK